LRDPLIALLSGNPISKLKLKSGTSTGQAMGYNGPSFCLIKNKINPQNMHGAMGHA
jgi:hypothetical protein